MSSNAPEIVIINKPLYRKVWGVEISSAVCFDRKNWKCIAGDNFLNVNMIDGLASVGYGEMEYDAFDLIPMITTSNKSEKLTFHDVVDIMGWKIEEGALWDC